MEVPVQKYQSYRKTKTASGTVTTITYRAESLEQAESFVTAYQIGSVHAVHGTLNTVELIAAEGIFYDITLIYGLETSPTGDIPSGSGSLSKRQELNVRMVSMPLESHRDQFGNRDYRVCWNYFLIGKGDVGTPSWWKDATSTAIDEPEKYAWTKSITSLEKGWKVLQDPKMPGTECYDIALYEVTEVGKYNSSTQAGWAASKDANQCKNKTYFGISGNWKCDGGRIAYDGKYWLATLTWTHGGYGGWDSRLYLGGSAGKNE